MTIKSHPRNTFGFFLPTGTIKIMYGASSITGSHYGFSRTSYGTPYLNEIMNF